MLLVISPEYLVADVIALVLFVLSIWRHAFARVAIGAALIALAMVNCYIAFFYPPDYLDFADVVAAPLYERLIHHYFSVHSRFFIWLTAGLQLLAGICMIWRERTWFVVACSCALLMLALAPGTAGPAFPGSILVAIACVIILLRETSEEYAVIGTGKNQHSNKVVNH